VRPEIPDVVDADAERAEGLAGRGDGTIEVGLVDGVRGEGEAADAFGLDERDGLGGGRPILVDDGDRHSGLREEDGHGAARAASGADDDRILARQTQQIRHRSILSVILRAERVAPFVPVA
jgi:hypothetical protein